MAAPIQKVAQTAYKIFSSGNLGALTELTKQVSKITAKDLNFLFDPEKDRPSPVRRAPALYVHLWEDKVFSMGIFVLRQGTKIPLHDHPSMYGICKVIQGTVTVKSFSRCVTNDSPKGTESPFLIPVKAVESTCYTTEEEKCCLLSPVQGNIHEIQAENGPAAFLDILAPPYDYETGARTCQYYLEVPTEETSDTKAKKLLKLIPPPRDFWCDEMDYCGPEIKPV